MKKEASLREKINKLDSLSLENNDLLYSILEGLLDRIEDLERKIKINNENSGPF